MKLINSCLIAFAMYSRIPVPGVEWKKENMRYVMCFFPIIGAVIGLCIYLAGRVLAGLEAGSLFRSAVFTLIPIGITGGIHMDGFMDTMDALASWGDRDKKLAILKDSHAGAFAILGMGCYLLWSVAVWSEMPAEALSCCCIIYVLSRSLSGLSVVTFPAAKDSGLVKMFQDGAQKKIVQMTMYLYLLSGVLVLFYLDPIFGMGAVSGGILTFIYYRVVSMGQFGGVTGDLAGYFLELAELFMLTGIWIASNWR